MSDRVFTVLIEGVPMPETVSHMMFTHMDARPFRIYEEMHDHVNFYNPSPVYMLAAFRCGHSRAYAIENMLRQLAEEHQVGDQDSHWYALTPEWLWERLPTLAPEYVRCDQGVPPPGNELYYDEQIRLYVAMKPTSVIEWPETANEMNVLRINNRSFPGDSHETDS